MTIIGRGQRPLRCAYEIALGSLSNSYAISSISVRSQSFARPFSRRDAVEQESVVVQLEEPPLSISNLVIVGRNSRGNWVAQEETGLFGGLFVSQAQAIKYALFENGHHPETIIMTAGIIELDMHRKTFTGATSNLAGFPQSRAA